MNVPSEPPDRDDEEDFDFLADIGLPALAGVALLVVVLLAIAVMASL